MKHAARDGLLCASPSISYHRMSRELTIWLM
jgi:hypothetical protein